MSKERRYQLIALGQAADQFATELDAEFESQIRDIGLDPGKDAEILRSPKMKQTDILWDAAPVAVWFGDTAPQPAQLHLDILEDFLVRRPNPVFPVCKSLVDYDKKVPPSLRSINGQEWDPASVVANVLKAFNLTREERQAFISYRRTDSRAVAQQIYDALQHRKFRVFLDTASVDAGVLFQDVLHGRLSDVDLVVFLDTKNALDSNWVYEELLQAEEQGFGILQVLWPDRRRDRATHFCDLFELKKLDFNSWSAPANSDQPDPSDTLKDAVVENIVREVERTRICSIRNRRDQVVTEIVDQAQGESLQANVSPTGNKKIPVSFIEFHDGTKPVALAFPVVGFPDSILLQGRHDLLKLGKLNLGSACVVYDEYCMTSDLKRHLEWLNDFLKIRTVPITQISGWLRGIVP